MSGPIPYITLMRQLLKILGDILKILHNDISKGIPCLIVFLWPYNGLETQIFNQPLSWYSQIIFYIWRYDFILFRLQNFKEIFKMMNLSPFLTYLFFLTLRRLNFFMLTGVKSQSVNFSSHKNFWLEQPWQTDSGVVTYRSFIFITYV